MISSCIYNGNVIHKRFKPKEHFFKYKVFSLFIDLSELNELNKKYELFKTIRGKGLLIGAVLKEDYSGRAGQLTTLAMQEGLMTLVAGPDVHRFAPPLIISESEIDDALTMLARAYSHFKKQT